MSEKLTSEAQLKAVKKYKEKTKKMTLDFAPTELQMWEHIQKQPIPKQTYIKNLIRADMAKAD
jgi:ssDNA-specific exonuclease RecJ